MNAPQESRYDAYLKSCAEKLTVAQMIRQKPAAYRTLEKNSEFFSGFALDYEHSFANPEYLHAQGFPDADLLSVIYQQFDRSLRNVILNRPIFVWNKSDVLVALRRYFEDFDRARLQRTYDRECIATQIECEDSRMLECSTVINAYNAVLKSAQPDNLDWMSGYGAYICGLERDMCRFWFSLPGAVLDRLALHIVDAFFHGFVSQSRAVAGRSNVRLVYAIGQEALARRVQDIFISRGMEVIILQPSTCAYGEQFFADHRYDHAVYQDPRCYRGQARAYRLAADHFEPYISNTCGFVRIGTFGAAPCPVVPGPHAFKAGKETLALYNEQLRDNRAAEAALLKPDTLSFCSVVFPDLRVGENFREIFDAFVQLNTEDSTPYELIQQTLIELLDGCERVHLKGRGENKTDLNVTLRKLDAPARQTNFLNCGGDINVPHGEMFTTPVLKGTSGVFNVRRVFLRGKDYRDLTLTFQDGLVVDYSCNNFASGAENRRYVLENLLCGTENAPMGEMSIGTNTLAYQLAMRFGLYERLPILLAEKMGPHIAVGDPCFARGEDSPVFNIYGGKEMVARDNERTAQRAAGDGCYVNFHTDITIPYDEMGLLEGITASGGSVPIIRDGRFVPDAADKLNQYLR